MKKQVLKISDFKKFKLAKPEAIKGGNDSDIVIINDETLG